MSVCPITVIWALLAIVLAWFGISLPELPAPA